MKVILDELYADEFFENGGIVLLKNGDTIDKSYAFRKLEKEDDFINHINLCKIGLHHYDYDTENGIFHYQDMKKYLSPKDPYGIKNVNFTLIDESDERWEKFKQQRLEQGFDETETWSLDSTIARFIYPRLKCFYNDGEMIGYPANLSANEWRDIVKGMLDGFELIVTKDNPTKEEDEIINQGLDLFRKYFFALWN